VEQLGGTVSGEDEASVMEARQERKENGVFLLVEIILISLAALPSASLSFTS
jgi:hypothetical protein